MYVDIYVCDIVCVCVCVCVCMCVCLCVSVCLYVSTTYVCMSMGVLSTGLFSDVNVGM